jgi:hypothetical protein
MPRQF